MIQFIPHHDWRPISFRLGVSLLFSVALHFCLLALVRIQFGAGFVSGASSRGPVEVSFRQAAGAEANPLAQPTLFVQPVENSSEVVPKGDFLPSNASGALTEVLPPATDLAAGVALPPPTPSSPFDGPWYFPAKYLHRLPAPYKPIVPVYPEPLEKVAGRVEMLINLNVKGEVDEIKILNVDKLGLFEESARDAFLKARFSPGMITGYPVKSQLQVEVLFEPGESPTANLSQVKKFLTAPAENVAGPQAPVIKVEPNQLPAR